MNNPIIEEIRRARAALAEEHGYDLKRINEWARKQTEARKEQAKTKAGSAKQAACAPPEADLAEMAQ